jgi:hypothetical protein
MPKLRKITVQVPKLALEKAQAYTGEGIARTVETALKLLASDLTRQEALKSHSK